jgi:hypothetical protein
LFYPNPWVGLVVSSLQEGWVGRQFLRLGSLENSVTEMARLLFILNARVGFLMGRRAVVSGIRVSDERAKKRFAFDVTGCKSDFQRNRRAFDLASCEVH